MDWSQYNRIAVALHDSLFLWSNYGTEAHKVYETNIGDGICSVGFCGEDKIAVGDGFGELSVIDLVRNKKVKGFSTNSGRVGSLAWNGNLLASGSKDGYIRTWDLRAGLASKYKSHSQ